MKLEFKFVMDDLLDQNTAVQNISIRGNFEIKEFIKNAIYLFNIGDNIEYFIHREPISLKYSENGHGTVVGYIKVASKLRMCIRTSDEAREICIDPRHYIDPGSDIEYIINYSNNMITIDRVYKNGFRRTKLFIKKILV